MADSCSISRTPISPQVLEKLVYDALVWCSLHGLVVGHKTNQRSGRVPGVGIVHAPFALLPSSFPRTHFVQACELTPIFNELIDRVSLDGNFLQQALSRTKKVDAFTSRLLDIHSKMLEIGKKEEIRLGLHRSDYMLDAQTNALLQVELNTISSSFAGLSCLVSELHRHLLSHYGEYLKLDSSRVPENESASQFADALAKAWKEYNDSRAVIVVVVQGEERNMYDQHWLCFRLKEKYGVMTIRKTLTEIEAEGRLQPDGTLLINEQSVAVIYFRAGYTPNDYPSESEWKARLLMEQSTAIKCPSISYHLAGTKKIQQELAKPNVLERQVIAVFLILLLLELFLLVILKFLDDKNDVAKLRKCFAGLWSLDDLKTMKDAIEQPELFVLKPQREGGGSSSTIDLQSNMIVTFVVIVVVLIITSYYSSKDFTRVVSLSGNNIYGDEVKQTLQKLQKDGSEELAAYILMQRIFPASSPAYMVQDGILHEDHAISELGIYGTYLRNKEKVIMNEQCGYLTRTKVSSSNEGGVVAGFGVLDSVYLI
ncbi:hypothetical protein IFM89_032378 [Coptis chinensis]|uniref:Glutathione synthetase n=1 Tax=Coptis chinensis TaxID=261450 RepID=A0A835HWS1_9MAGN|nr:hypothetical protein IFM89_032378 [Coptis chinensis]